MAEESPPQIPSSAQKKKAVFRRLKKHADRDAVKKALQQAAFLRLDVTVCFDEALDRLRAAYAAVQEFPPLAHQMREVISNYIETIGFKNFEDSFKGKFSEEKFNHLFLELMCEFFNFPKETEHLVEVAIKDGKLYWRIMLGTEEIYDRQKNKRKPAGHFNEWPKFLMTWEQFIVFKSGGKRGGKVILTKEKFFQAYTGRDKQLAAIPIWDELKRENVLTSQERLSMGWRTFSNNTLVLSSGKFKNKYEKAIFAIDTILQEDEGKEIIATPSMIFTFSRVERTSKSWNEEGNVKNADCKTEKFSSKMWDVGVGSELQAYRYTELEEKLYGRKLNYDHVPACLEFKEMEKDEGALWVVAVPEELHRSGNTFLKRYRNESGEHPFLSDIRTYCEILSSKNGSKFLAVPSDFLKALGAFRYLYRCQVKEPPKPIQTQCRVSRAPFEFFRQRASQNPTIDQFFSQQAVAFVNRTEAPESTVYIKKEKKLYK